MVQRRGPNRFKRGLGRFLQELGGGITDIWAQAPARQALLLQNQKTMREQEAARNYLELLPELLGQPEQTPPVRRQETPEQVVAPPPELPTTVRRRELPEQVGAPPPVAPFRVTPQSLRDTAARMKPEERVGSGVLTDTPPDPRGGLTLSDRMAYDLMRTPRELPPLSQGAAPSVGSGPVPMTPPTPIPLGWEAAPTPTPTAAPAPTAPARPPTAPAVAAPPPPAPTAPIGPGVRTPSEFHAQRMEHSYMPPSEPGPQWSPEVLELRRLGRLAGYDQAQIDEDLASVEPLPQWTEYQQARALAEQARAPESFKSDTVLDPYGTQAEEYYNVIMRQNPWLFNWMSTQDEYAPHMETSFPWISRHSGRSEPPPLPNIDNDELVDGTTLRDVLKSFDPTQFYSVPGADDPATGLPRQFRRTKMSDKAIDALTSLPNIAQNVERMFELAEGLNQEESRFAALVQAKIDQTQAFFGTLEAIEAGDASRAYEEGTLTGFLKNFSNLMSTDRKYDEILEEAREEYNNNQENAPLKEESYKNISDYVRQLAAMRMGLAGPIARTIGQEVGVLTDADIMRVQLMLPQIGDTKGQTAMKKDNIYRNMINMFYGAHYGPNYLATIVIDTLFPQPVAPGAVNISKPVGDNVIQK